MNLSKPLPTYGLLALASSAYAAALSTDEGKRFATERTAETVVIGVALVLVALRFVLPVVAFRAVVVAFLVAGSPMIARSLMKREGVI